MAVVDREAVRDTPWHTRPADDVVQELETDAESGLSADEAADRLEEYGPNQIRTGEMMPWWRILLHQFTDPLIYILLIAAGVSVLIQEWIDAIVILAVVVLNGAIGFVQEFRARKAIQALAELSAPRARVIRDGKDKEVESEDVVPGDVVKLASGGQVPADVRLLEVDELEADESALTGESEPVSKQADPVEDEKAVPGDQLSMAFSGTAVTRGRGLGVVVRTGDLTELGQIAEATQEVEEVKTPIQQKMDYLGKAIGVAVLVLSGAVIGIGLLLGWELHDIVRTAVALAVGTVPEALPVVLTVTLAIGVRRMARRNAIIRSLPAVETLGSTTVIGSDKTGTLTKNQMTVKAIWSAGRRYEVTGAGYEPEGEIRAVAGTGDGDGDGGGDSDHNGDGAGELPESVRMTLLAGLLANETESLPDEDGGGGGDPTELAVLVSAVKAGYGLEETREEYGQVDLIPFESERQFMATLNETPDGRCIFVKGSPEAVLERCSAQVGVDGEEQELDRDAILAAASELAEEGYRDLAMAFRYDDREDLEDHDPGDDLVFAGLQAMEDPVRPEAVDAVRAAHDAGIRVLMLTGDHAKTARAIGDQLSLGGEGRAEEGRNLEDFSGEELDRVIGEVDVYARVSPEHKLRIVQQLRKQGHIVAVTGDGVNDAPALQAAHLGIAMGQAGTDVAREASDMVLADDNFASITNAVEEGRVVFANIRKVTYFLLSTGVGLVLTILSALFAPWPLPYVAAQVLWINLVTKGLQDVALAFEPGEPGLLTEPPRDPQEGVINRPVLHRMVWLGVFMAIGTMGTFWWILQQDVSLELARSVAMTQMVMFQFFHLFNCRSFHRSIFKVSFFGNPYVVGAVGISLLAHLGILHLPFMQVVFDTEPIPLEIWGIIVAVSFSIIVVAEVDKATLRRKHRAGEEERPGKEERPENGERPETAETAETAERPETETETAERAEGAERETGEAEEGEAEVFRREVEVREETEYRDPETGEVRKDVEERKKSEYRRGPEAGKKAAEAEKRKREREGD